MGKNMRGGSGFWELGSRIGASNWECFWVWDGIYVERERERGNQICAYGYIYIHTYIQKLG